MLNLKSSIRLKLQCITENGKIGLYMIRTKAWLLMRRVSLAMTMVDLCMMEKLLNSIKMINMIY